MFMTVLLLVLVVLVVVVVVVLATSKLMMVMLSGFKVSEIESVIKAKIVNGLDVIRVKATTRDCVN